MLRAVGAAAWQRQDAAQAVSREAGREREPAVASHPPHGGCGFLGNHLLLQPRQQQQPHRRVADAVICGTCGTAGLGASLQYVPNGVAQYAAHCGCCFLCAPLLCSVLWRHVQRPGRPCMQYASAAPLRTFDIFFRAFLCAWAPQEMAVGQHYVRA
jgi:hypothetical protein